MLDRPGASPILKLPHSVRAKIYQYAGVPSKTEIYLNGSFYKLKENRTRHRNIGLASSHALLLTCRLTYKEVTGILFSTNLLLLRPLDPFEPRLLSNLRPGTLKLVRHLTINLNYNRGRPTSPTGNVFERCIGQNFEVNASRSLSLCPEDEVLLEEWQLAITWVLKHVKPNTLCLRVVCDCKDLRTAEYVCRPIFDSNIALSNCELRLGLKREEELSREAQTTANRAMRQYSPDGPFPFMRLPPEIRRYVLELTDLLTPQREVEWAPRVGYRTILKFTDVSDGRELEPCCGNLGYPYSLGPCTPTRHDNGCFCRRYHSAYSRICKCWLHPYPMFRVSRTFRNEAASVFFSQNRFVVRSKRGFDCAAKYTPSRIAPTIFFYTLGDQLQHLRYLELVFPPIDYDYLRRDDPAYSRWLESIEFARERLNLPHLTLFVAMADHAKSGRNITHFRYNISAEQCDTIIKMYFRIIEPLRQLKEKGLKKFFVSLALPYNWTQEGQRRSREEAATVAQEAAELEYKVEQAVMGEDYDSLAMGKGTLQRSQWTNRFGRELNMFTHPVDNSESENDLDE